MASGRVPPPIFAIRQAKEGGHNLMDDFKDKERAAYSDTRALTEQARRRTVLPYRAFLYMTLKLCFLQPGEIEVKSPVHLHA